MELYKQIISFLSWDLLATALSTIALILSILTFKKSSRQALYAQFDQMNNENIKMAIEKPHLRNINAKRDANEALEYHSYAQLVWCFIETLYDHARSDKRLFTTWKSAIEVECHFHRRWFEQEENFLYFPRADFHEYIRKNF